MVWYQPIIPLRRRRGSWRQVNPLFPALPSVSLTDRDYFGGRVDRTGFLCYAEDPFLPENTGTYTVSFADGKAISVERCGCEGDLSVTADTFAQLAIGLITPSEAVYRNGTALRANRETLEQVFVRKILGA